MRFLILGQGAREHAIAERLSREGHKIYVYQVKPNLGLLNLAEKVWLEPRYNISKIIKIAEDFKIDIIFPCNEHPIFMGIKDISFKRGLKCCAPFASLTLLERDRRYSKTLILKNDPFINIPFKVLKTYKDFLNFILVRGLPVVLKSNNSFLDFVFKPDRKKFLWYFQYCQKNKSYLIVEKYIDGYDFYIIGLADGRRCLFSKVVVSYPFIVKNERQYIKTGGMASISYSKLPPGLSNEEFNRACFCIQNILASLKKEFKLGYTGFITGQFIKAKSGIYFNEFDIMPGDPEIINFLEFFTGDFGSLINKMCLGELEAVPISNNCVVCVYLMPHSYPKFFKRQCFKLIQDRKLLRQIYFSETYQKGQLVYTGTSRTLAVFDKGLDLLKVKKKVLRTIRKLDTGLYYRSDFLK